MQHGRQFERLLARANYGCQARQQGAALASRFFVAQDRGGQIGGRVAGRAEDRRLHPTVLALFHRQTMQGRGCGGRLEFAQGKGQLQSHARFGIVHQREYPLAQRVMLAEPTLRQLQRMGPDREVRIVQGRLDYGGGQLPEPVQRVQGMQPRLGRGTADRQGFKRLCHRTLAAFHQQSLRRLAPKRVGMLQRFHQRCGIRSFQIHRVSRRHVAVKDSPDAAFFAAGDQRLDVQLLQIARDGRVVLDDRPVHVHDVQGAVRPHAQVHRTEPLLGGRQELDLLRPVRTHGPVTGTVRNQAAVMHQILRVVDAEMAVAVLGGKLIGPVNGLPAGRREETAGGGLGHAVELDPRGIVGAGQPPGIGLAGRIHPCRMAVGADIDDRVRGRPVGIADQVAMRQRRHEQNVLLVGHQEPVSPVVHGQSETAGAAADRFDGGSVRAEAETRRAELDGRGQLRTGDPAPAADAVDRVDPVVQTPTRVVDPRPHLAHAEPGEQRLADLGPAVAVAIRQIDDVRRAQHDHSVASRNNSVTAGQAIRPHGHSIEAAVAVGVLQPFDRAVLLRHRLSLGRFVGGNAAHRRIQFAASVQIEDVQVTFQVVAVDLADE